MEYDFQSVDFIRTQMEKFSGKLITDLAMGNKYISPCTSRLNITIMEELLVDVLDTLVKTGMNPKLNHDGFYTDDSVCKEGCFLNNTLRFYL